MADELKTNAQISYLFGGDSVNQAFSDTTTVATEPKLVSTESMGTGGANISAGPLSSFGQTWVKNLDATNYVELSWDGGSTYFALLLPGEWLKVRPPTASNLWIRANTGACICAIYAFSPVT